MENGQESGLGSELSEQFGANVDRHQGYVPFLLANVVHKVARKGVSSELLYAGDFVLMNETIDKLR